MSYALAAIGIGAAILAVAASRKRMPWPVVGAITSPFGPRRHPITEVVSFHNGVDIAAPVGTPVRAPVASRVMSVYYHPAGGNTVILQLENGYRAGFAHLDRVDVVSGQLLDAAAQIGTVGATGQVTGPHLHYTLHDGDAYVNPEHLHHA